MIHPYLIHTHNCFSSYSQRCKLITCGAKVTRIDDIAILGIRNALNLIQNDRPLAQGEKLLRILRCQPPYFRIL